MISELEKKTYRGLTNVIKRRARLITVKKIQFFNFFSVAIAKLAVKCIFDTWGHLKIVLSISASAWAILTTKTGADRQCIYLFLSSISSLWSDTSLKITLSVYIHTNHICFKTNSKTWKVTSIRSEVFFYHLRFKHFCEENFFLVFFVEKSLFIYHC